MTKDNSKCEIIDAIHGKEVADGYILSGQQSVEKSIFWRAIYIMLTDIPNAANFASLMLEQVAACLRCTK